MTPSHVTMSYTLQLGWSDHLVTKTLAVRVEKFRNPVPVIEHQIGSSIARKNIIKEAQV